MQRRYWNLPGLIVPIVVCAVGLLLWRRYGFEPLDRIELPLAAFLNGLTGRNETFDYLVIFLNHLWGELLFVIIAFAGYLLLARWVVGPKIDWRPAAAFAGYVFAFWIIANAIGDLVIEEYMPRKSPSYQLVDHPGGFVDLQEVRQTQVKTESRSSFPSNHGSVFFTVFSFCLLRFGWKAWVLLPLMIMLSLPRCFVGAHWVGDTVVGSWLVTWLVAAIALNTPLYRLCLWAEDIALRTPASAPVGHWIDAKRKPTR